MDVRLLVVLLATTALAGIALEATAQVVEEELVPITHPCSRTSRLESAQDCADASSGSLIIERDISFELPLASHTLETGKCQAEVAVDYVQNDTYAGVSGSVDTQTCAAASGSFVLVVRTVDGAETVDIREYPQQWQRDDARPVPFSASLPIPGDTDLLRVRARSIRCTCTEAPQE